MNRRDFAKGAVGLAIAGLRTESFGMNAENRLGEAESLPARVAGVRLVDSKIAKEATRLSRAVSPPYLFNHVLRTFLFGSLVGRAQRQKFDEEILYLASILHDLGLTERFEGDLPFEIQGAEAARRFLDEHAYAKDKAGVVWDGIAMHASVFQGETEFQVFSPSSCSHL
jgi:hypothetical protein